MLAGVNNSPGRDQRGDPGPIEPDDRNNHNATKDKHSDVITADEAYRRYISVCQRTFLSGDLLKVLIYGGLWVCLRLRLIGF
jgi:hypothetical protein